MKLARASNRSPIRLGAELGRGGEGAVFEVHGNPAVVAKIYKKPPSAIKGEKLQAMSRSATPGILRIAAWPIDVLVDEQRTVRGFLMPMVSSREDLHELYSPKSRAETFPDADFRFIVRVATNLARAFATVHAQGHVIGDVNHGNALVGHDGTVVLIDCDSFQTRDRIKTYSCDVGVPLFTAPELQGKDFRGLRRSTNHDAFGLAVLIFHLLFQGRHPFAGRYAHGEITMERAISEYRFAFSNSNATGMSPPPGVLSLTAFGLPVAELFLRAFETRASNGARPTALEWIDALERLEQSLVACAAVPIHYHVADSPCCWCDLERKGKVRFFGRRLVDAGRAKIADVEALWKAIMAVPHPGPAPELQLEHASSPANEPSRRFRIQLKRIVNPVVIGATAVSLIALMAGFTKALPLFAAFAVLAYQTLEVGRFARARRALLDQATTRWEQALKLWNDQCSSAGFDETLAQLRIVRLEILRLSLECKREVDKYLQSGKQRALRSYLRSIRLERLPAHLLAPGQVKKLNGFGIFTAEDIERHIASIPHLLSLKAADDLLTWYRMQRRDFRGPAEDPDQREVAAIEQRYAALQNRLAQQLREGPAHLQRQNEEVEKARQRLRPSTKAAWDELNRAQQQSE